MENTIINIAVFLVSAVIFTFVGFFVRKKIAESKMESAENEAKRIIEVATRDAENRKKEEIFKAKEEIMNARKDLDQEIKERRGEVQSQERRVIQKEENLENRINQLEKKEQDLLRKDSELDNKAVELENVINQQKEELQRISRMTVEEAKKFLLSEVEKELVMEKANMIKNYEEETKEKADKSAKEIISYAIQKCAADHTSEASISRFA